MVAEFAVRPSHAVPALPRIHLFGIPIDNVTLPWAVEMILDQLDGDEPRQVCFVNADCVNRAYRHPEYKAVLEQADMVLADGAGMRLAGDALGQPIRDNVNGTDLFPLLAAALEGSGKRIYLLGGRPGVAEGVARWLAMAYPVLDVAGHHHGYFAADIEDDVIEAINNSGADLLLVAFGAPRQDVWIDRHLDRLSVKVAMGVGGLFDFYCGRIPRAPHWVRKAGCEWLYRLYQEPARLWKRYLVGNLVFLARLARLTLAW